MKERPILMTPENAQQCFQGTKTQTRRMVQLTDTGRVKLVGSPKNWHLDDPSAIKACPFGQPGDRLWVREPFAWPGEEAFLYRGNPKHVTLAEMWKTDSSYPQVKWTPSIHMPRWACRTVLELTEVRVERLNEISHEDALAEGCTGQGWKVSDTAHPVVYPFDAFRTLWESINGPGSWGLNPWVWVLTFKKATNAEGETRA